MACDSHHTISFDEIIHGRDSNVRVTVDGLIYAVDLVMAVTNASRDDSGKTLRRLSENIFSSEKFSERQLSSRGGAPTKLLTFQHAIELVMVLPGKVAKETRVQFATIIRRFIGGDESIVEEIEANAQSTSPVAQMARTSLINNEEEQDRKRRRVLEDVQLQKMHAEIKTQNLSNTGMFMELMTQLNPKWKDDVRLRMQTEDMLKNAAMVNSSVLAITDAASKDHSSISISQVAGELGRRLTHAQLIKAGRLAAKAYYEKYGTDPPVHSQWVDGAERMVKSYTEVDRLLVETAVMGV